MKKYGVDISSKEAWDIHAQGYSSRLATEYHIHRLKVIDAMIPDVLYQEGKQILDFGCGDAAHFEKFLTVGVDIIGMDISNEMITLAEQRLASDSGGNCRVFLGGAPEMASLESNSLDAIMSFNVIAYLTDEEEGEFYRQAYRLLRPGGYLIVTHSNELFDMYSLNQYTADFFKRNFVADFCEKSALNELLACSSSDDEIVTFNVRENPLSYKFKLDTYGFTEKHQEFINLHKAPPSLLPDKKTYPDTLSWDRSEKWKLMFICSTFGSVSIKN